MASSGQRWAVGCESLITIVCPLKGHWIVTVLPWLACDLACVKCGTGGHHMAMDVASRPHMCSLTNAHQCLTLSPVLCLMLGLKEKSKAMASVHMKLIQKQLLIFKDLIFKLLWYERMLSRRTFMSLDYGNGIFQHSWSCCWFLCKILLQWNHFF